MFVVRLIKIKKKKNEILFKLCFFSCSQDQFETVVERCIDNKISIHQRQEKQMIFNTHYKTVEKMRKQKVCDLCAFYCIV